MTDEIIREGVSSGTTAANVLFGINMREAFELPLTWMQKHLQSGSSIKGHAPRGGCQNPGARSEFFSSYIAQRQEGITV